MIFGQRSDRLIERSIGMPFFLDSDAIGRPMTSPHETAQPE